MCPLLTLYSAFKDSRFQPIDAKEVPLLHCGVSVLTDFEHVDDVYDWTVSIHQSSILTFPNRLVHMAFRSSTKIHEVALAEALRTFQKSARSSSGHIKSVWSH